jgi:hypothetical protein
MIGLIVQGFVIYSGKETMQLISSVVKPTSEGIASYQGKINIDPKGVVYGFEIKNMTVPEMEKDIADLLSRHINDTSNRNATEEAMYANDSDIMFNESEINASAN